MDAYRTAAQKYLQLAQKQNIENISNLELSSDILPSNIKLQDVWRDVVNNEALGSDNSVLENLLVVEASVRNLEPQSLGPEEQNAVHSIICWLKGAILPSEEFTTSWEELQISDEQRDLILCKHRKATLKSDIGMDILCQLNSILSYNPGDYLVDILSLLAAYSRPADPWTSDRCARNAVSALEKYESLLRQNGRNVFAKTLEEMLQKWIKVSFSKTRNPTLSSAGRKNLHPVSEPRFDPSLFDTSSKPWKFKDIYVVTILDWIVHRYLPSDKVVIEAQFPLLVPPILSLIDDDSLAFKARGCQLLHQLLHPLEETKSDILQRTNLDSVFQDGLSHCLLSIPTITPEKQSVHLLSYAYPAIFAVIRTRYPATHITATNNSLLQPFLTQPKLKPQQKNQGAAQQRLSSLTRILRHHIISSFLHTSNPRPLEDSSISSHPHPLLSTLLLNQLNIVIRELGIVVTTHLQDIVPLLTSTLGNPFGTSYIPLLNAAAECYVTLLLNAWPRIPRWRGEILAGICSCSLNLSDDEEIIRSQNGDDSLEKLRIHLKNSVKLLKVIMSEPTVSSGDNVDFDAELQQLGVDGENFR
ncbi:hypothetical protein FQN57_003753 [Myotisia sp. PD_48]|nr:hypothetical protein FQN57_003753 [Myotisia sp. PD_48]